MGFDDVELVPADVGDRPRGGPSEPKGPLAHLQYGGGLGALSADHAQAEPGRPSLPAMLPTDPGAARYDSLDTGLLL